MENDTGTQEPIEIAELASFTSHDPPNGENIALESGLISDANKKQATFRERNSTYEKKSVYRGDVDHLLGKGWEVSKVGKRKATLRRPKSHFRLLEDRAWCLLYRMGYAEVSSDRFLLRFIRANGTVGTKQIDAFACDEETVIVTECKSREERGRRSLQKDILETASLQQHIRTTVFRHYKERPKPKIIWLYVTSNIIWSENDVERAKEYNIQIITENELLYYETFLKHMGSAGRYQILGEFLKGQRIPALLGQKVPAIRGKIGDQTFFSFVTTPKNLLKIAFINHHALNHPDGRPAYQRMVNSKRIREIGEFITKKHGFFPTNIIVNFTQSTRFDLISNKENKTLTSNSAGYICLPHISQLG